MKISSLNFKNNLRENAVLSLVHGKEMILKNEVKDFLTKEFADQGFDETIIFEANESDGLLSAIQNNLGGDLFGSQLIIKVVHSEGRFPKDLSEILEKIDLDNMSNIKIIIDSISESISSNTKWIKDNKEYVQIIECKKLKPLDEKKWLREKLNFLDKNDADRVARHLFELNSSNLVAHRNDIETLKILHTAEKDSVSLENSISSSIHTAYELEDCLLNLDEKKSIKLSSYIAIFGLINVPIIKFSVDWWSTLHQPSSVNVFKETTIHSTMLMLLGIMTAAFALFSILIFLMKYHTELLKIKNKGLDRL